MSDEFVDIGDCSIDECGDANIPMNVWLIRRKAENEDDIEYSIEEYPFCLNAGNYMPREGIVTEMAYNVLGSKEQLNKLVQEKIIPLYQTAINLLNKMCENPEGDSLYYWHEDD